MAAAPLDPDAYSGGNVVSSSGEGINEIEQLEGTWLPPGATISGFTHAHPPPSVIVRTFGAKDTSFRGTGGFHLGDKTAADNSWESRGRPSPWVEGISTPSGGLEFYYPGTGRSNVQPRLRGLPAYR